MTESQENKLMDAQEILVKQEVLLDALTKIVSDHENRIRYTEKFMSYGMGCLGLLSFISNLVLAFYSKQ